MQLNNLSSIKTKSKRRLGQGHGSGRVKTAGRGTKGQNARSSRSMSFEGGALPLIKRLPFRRGKSRNKTFQKKSVIVNIEALNIFKAASVIDLKALVEKKLVDAKEAADCGVKILGDGEIKVALTIKLPISKQAEAKIIKAGGQIQSADKAVKTDATTKQK